jgi:hypothetical protein
MSQFLFTFHQALAHLWRHLFGDFFGIKGRGPFDSNKPKFKKTNREYHSYETKMDIFWLVIYVSVPGPRTKPLSAMSGN